MKGKEAIRKHNNHLQAKVPYLDHTLLHDPGPANSEVFLGQGSFAVLKLKLFRGTHGKTAAVLAVETFG